MIGVKLPKSKEDCFDFHEGIEMKTAVDLYCGSGAVTHGMKTAGFRVLGAVDIDTTACETYRANHPEVDLFQGDIKDPTIPERFLQYLDGPLDLLAVCAPCQPFSNRNNKRSNADLRRNLVMESIRFVRTLRPRLVFFENVPGLGRQPIFDRLADELTQMGYYLGEPTKIDAAELGVPQRRQRMVLIGAQSEELLQQAIDIVSPARMTVRDAIEDLPIPPVKGGSPATDPLHFSRTHAAITLERLRYIPRDGGSRDSLPENLQLACHKGRNKNSFPDSYGRMKWDDVAPTLTTGCNDLTKGRYAHPVQDRAITLREAARLQSFPDSYIFRGNSSQIATQIGNSVPPRMMDEIARTLHSALLAPL